MSAGLLIVAKRELRNLARDSSLYVLLVAVPVLLMVFLEPVYAPVISQVVNGASGAEQVVPGMATMFGFFVVSLTATSFVEERVWGTWERVRSLPIGAVEFMGGKLVPMLLVGIIQHVVLIAAGVIFLDLVVRGSLMALSLVIVSWSLSLVALGALVAALCRSLQQVAVFSNLSFAVAATIGGALVPVSLLPSWAQHVSPALPTYWAMRGFRDTLAQGSSLGAVWFPVGVMLGFSVALGLGAGTVARRTQSLRFVG